MRPVARVVADVRGHPNPDGRESNALRSFLGWQAVDVDGSGQEAKGGLPDVAA